ncbi:MAG: glycosyltransferase [Bacteroidetes bacterium]|nr:glycosyltransferase [Bacteroidota bacterium]
MPVKSIRVWATWPESDASTRYRLAQFYPFFLEEGYIITTDYLFPEYFYRIKNRPGLLVAVFKIILMMVFLTGRIFRLPLAAKADINIIHREGFPFFTPVTEWIIRRFSSFLIFDFDDAIYSKPDKWKNWRDYLRNPAQVNRIIAMADTVWAGSGYLARHSEAFNRSVVMVPTIYHAYPIEKPANPVPVIGWIGSWTTLINLDLIGEALTELAKTDQFIFSVIGASNIREFSPEGVHVSYHLWSPQEEQTRLPAFDVGVMPLFDTPWERGKCGFKLIQYMSLGIASVASPVGANLEIIKNNETGLLAGSKDEWINQLRLLIRQPQKRKQLALAGYEFVRDNYSYESNCSRMKGSLEKA